MIKVSWGYVTDNEVNGMDVKDKGMQKRMILAAAAVAVVAIVAAVLILAPGKKEETYRSIKIIELGGSVTIEREGVGVLAASSNMNLISGDAVKTEQDAYAVLQLDADKYVMLAESGSMTIVAEGDEANSRTAIQLETGSVLNEIQNPLSNGSSYDIVTPNATMSVRGTVFEVRKNGDSIELLVYDGKVAVGLDGMEPVLYEAGEYTQFTEGESPRFIIDRTEITEENLNPQFMERLEQIDSQSRELNLGTAQSASAQETVSPEPAATPVPAIAPVQTAPASVPVSGASPTVTQTPGPVKTFIPQADVKESGVAVPETSPAVEDTEPDDDDQPDWDSDENDRPVQNPDESGHPAQNPGENNGPAQNPGGNDHPAQNPGDNNKYQDFWKTYSITDYQQTVSGGNADTAECNVVYYLPYTVNAADNGESTLRTDAPAVYASEKVAAGSSLTEPEPPEGYIDYRRDMPLEFEYWCLEDGTKWVGTDIVNSDLCLYPVWKDGDGALYYPVICRCTGAWGHYYYCNCVKADSRLAGIDFSNNAGIPFPGWERVNSNNVIWNFNSDTVKGAESLKMFWSK